MWDIGSGGGGELRGSDIEHGLEQLATRREPKFYPKNMVSRQRLTALQYCWSRSQRNTCNMTSIFVACGKRMSKEMLNLTPSRWRVTRGHQRSISTPSPSSPPPVSPSPRTRVYAALYCVGRRIFSLPFLQVERHWYIDTVRWQSKWNWARITLQNAPAGARSREGQRTVTQHWQPQQYYDERLWRIYPNRQAGLPLSCCHEKRFSHIFETVWRVAVWTVLSRKSATV